MRSKSRAKRSNTELNPLIGDFINTIGHKQTFGKRPPGVRFTPISGHRPTRRMLSRVGTQMWKDWRAI
jgi:hypothetical protein